MGKILYKSGLRADLNENKGSDECTSILLFCIPDSISNFELERIFRGFGDIKEISYNNNNNSEYHSSNDSNRNSESVESWVYITYHNSLPINKMKQNSEFDPKYLFRMLYIEDSIIFDDIDTYKNKDDYNKGVQEIIIDIMKKRADPGYLKKEIDIYMAKQDIEMEIIKENLKLESTIPDEDGFIKVVNKKQKTPDGTVVYSFCPEVDDYIIGSRTRKNSKNKEKKKKEYSDFYKFQIREQKMQDMQKLLH